MTSSQRTIKGPICEFCYRPAPEDTEKAGWDLVWQSFVCPGCQLLVARDGGYAVVKCGAYAGIPDPRGQ